MPAPPSEPRILLAGRLIDGTGRVPLERQALVLEDGRIRRVLPQSELTRTDLQSGPVLGCGDATVLPGLIDTHVHVTFNAAPTHAEVRAGLEEETDAALALRGLANAQKHLASGVTTLRDVGGRGYVTLALRDAIRDGLVLGPRMQAAGPAITCRGGHLHYLGAVAEGVEEVRARATEALDRGADLVKICATGGIMTAESDPIGSHYTEAELRAAVDVAEGRGTLVAAHVLASEALRRCVAAGVRSLEHCMFQESPGVYRFEPGLAREMLQKGLFAGLTFAGVGRARYLEEVLGATSGEDLGVWRSRMEARYAEERKLVDSGVPYVLHSDAGVRQTPFGSFWLTLASACYELRLEPLEAIRAVTSTAAELMGLASEVGTVAVGKRADLLVVRGDPSVGIEALAETEHVLLGGRIVAEGGFLRTAWGKSTGHV